MPILERLSPDQALDRVRDVLGERITDLHLNHEQVDLVCEPANLVEVVRTLKTAESLKCEFFTFLSGVDRSEFGGGEGDKAGGLEVLIHLYSPDYVVHVNIHVPVDAANPTCPSITDLFLGALWHERETYEMFGIDFEGHPRLVNLYLPEDFVGHP